MVMPIFIKIRHLEKETIISEQPSYTSDSNRVIHGLFFSPSLRYLTSPVKQKPQIINNGRWTKTNDAIHHVI